MPAADQSLLKQKLNLHPPFLFAELILKYLLQSVLLINFKVMTYFIFLEFTIN